MFGDALRHTKLVAISPLTAEVLAEARPSRRRRRRNLHDGRHLAAILAAER